MIGRGFTSQAGFTLAEVLVAIAVLSIGFIGLGTAVSLQGGVAGGTTNGHAGITRSYYVSAATMLAQQRLEEVKRLTYTLSTDQLQTPTPTGFADEAFGAISGYPNFSRQVRVQAYPSENMKTITVTVSYRIISTSGSRTESLGLSTLVAARP